MSHELRHFPMAEACALSSGRGRHSLDIEHTLREIIPGKKRKGRFQALLHKASNAASRNTLIACGNFNTMNPAWGYNKYTAKGRNLYRDATELDFTLITDPTHLTRIGNSVSRDTSARQ
ncbi:hypothetical protein HPB50_000697 [Hyalomma asiaticum]|uniref:Uncharacterized protein n=1 Tax=Hyalomma asiaticum TaxID=266040 RepID=A0ACB7SL46_HYAAI|nr:hypothetical protein HPB50_000697 [Hyalomma asiaticum]